METWVEENTDSNKYITYKFTGKELDEETGLYYFGARYYDSKTSVFISADPIYDGVKEGFGVYTYCRNNPMMYTDPTGLESAYLLESKAVKGAGHAGMYVEKFDKDGKSVGFSFSEANDLSKMTNTNGDKPGDISPGDTIANYRGTGYDATVLSSEKAFGVAGNAGVINIDFKSKAELDDFLSKSPFDQIIKFDTSLEQDTAVLESAQERGKNFGTYVIPGNHCGTYAADSLHADGKGIQKNTTINFIESLAWGAIGAAYQNQSPNEIGRNISIANKKKIEKLKKEK